MKKVLFATTALVASAGIASAQGVALSGSLEMGVVGGSVYDDNMQFHTDVDVKFSFSGETDNGLTFGGSVDLDEGIGNSPGSTATRADTLQGGETIFISGAFGTLTMGDTDGALDWALQELDIVADINDSNTGHAGFSGGNELDGIYDGQIARYNYSFGDFSFAASVEIDDTGVGDPVYGIGAKYSTSLSSVDLAFGLGYQDADGIDGWGASVDATFAGGFQVVASYASFDDGVDNVDHYGIGVFYSMDAISVGVNYGAYDIDGDVDAGFGIAANYDLGGGAVLQAGYGANTTCDLGCDEDDDSFSLGLAMSF